jgi:hypothetical protein
MYTWNPSTQETVQEDCEFEVSLSYKKKKETEINKYTEHIKALNFSLSRRKVLGRCNGSNL